MLLYNIKTKLDINILIFIIYIIAFSLNKIYYFTSSEENENTILNLRTYFKNIVKDLWYEDTATCVVFIFQIHLIYIQIQYFQFCVLCFNIGMN